MHLGVELDLCRDIRDHTWTLSKMRLLGWVPVIFIFGFVFSYAIDRRGYIPAGVRSLSRTCDKTHKFTRGL